MTPSLKDKDVSNFSSIRHGRYQSDFSSKVIRDFDRLQQSDTERVSLEPLNRIEQLNTQIEMAERTRVG